MWHYWQKIKDFPHEVKRGIQSIFMWLPIIWKDRQWDHTYIYMIFRHKLHLTEQLIRNHGIHENHLIDANRIKSCVTILDRLMEDVYHDMAFEKHYKKWGEPKMSFKPSDEYPDCSQLHIKYPNVKTKQDEELEREGFRKASEHEVKLRESDLETLFRTMHKHIQEWWD